MPASIPNDLTVLSRSTHSWRADGLSSQPRSSVPFIFTAWKPWCWRARLCCVSSGVLQMEVLKYRFNAPQALIKVKLNLLLDLNMSGVDHHLSIRIL